MAEGQGCRRGNCTPLTSSTTPSYKSPRNFINPANFLVVILLLSYGLASQAAIAAARPHSEAESSLKTMYGAESSRSILLHRLRRHSADQRMAEILALRQLMRWYDEEQHGHGYVDPASIGRKRRSAVDHHGISTNQDRKQFEEHSGSNQENYSQSEEIDKSVGGIHNQRLNED